MFLLAYVVYLWRELRGAQVVSEETLEPLKLHPKGDPDLWPLMQTTLALIDRDASKVFVAVGNHRDLGGAVAPAGGAAIEPGGH